MVYIYKILNKINGKFYIGSTNNAKRRWNQHRTELNKNIHCNKHLQNAWNKYGENNFDFIILEKSMDEDNQFEMEQKYLNELNPFNLKGYNISRNANGGSKELTKEDINNIIYAKKLFKEGLKMSLVQKSTNLPYETLNNIKVMTRYQYISEEYNPFLFNDFTIDTINSNSRIRFGISLEELRHKDNKTDKEQSFLDEVYILLNNLEYKRDKIKEYIINNYYSDDWMEHELNYIEIEIIKDEYNKQRLKINKNINKIKAQINKISNNEDTNKRNVKRKIDSRKEEISELKGELDYLKEEFNTCIKKSKLYKYYNQYALYYNLTPLDCLD